MAIQLFITPFVMIPLLTPAFRAALHEHGYISATGAEQAVPGVTVLFGLFFGNTISFSFLQEHGWHTWERLRAAPVRSWEIMDGKCVAFLVFAVGQQTLLLLLAGHLFDMRIRGSIVAMLVVGGATALNFLFLGLFMAAFAQTAEQLNIMSGLLSILFAGIGGAVTPVWLLPNWARAVAPVSPAYWAMKGYRAVILEQGGMREVVAPVLVLLAFALVLGALTAYRFRFDEPKKSFI